MNDSKIIKKFCENILNYNDLKFLKNKQKILKLSIISLKKFFKEKNNIYYRRAYILYTILNNLKKDYNFFFSLIDQPYLNKYIHSSNLKNIQNFIKSDDLSKTAIFIKQITTKNLFEDLTLKIIGYSDIVCLIPRWFVTYNIDEINYINKLKKNKYNTTLAQKNKFSFLTDINLTVIKLIKDERPNLKKYKNIILKQNTDNLKKIKDCIKKAKNGLIRFIYYEMNLIIENIADSDLFIPTNHRSNVILDFIDYKKTNTVNVLFVDTNIDFTKEWTYIENIIIDSIQNDLKCNLDLNSNIISFDMEECPRFNIQGHLGTCAIWSLYTFYLYTFYPNRKIIYSILKDLDLKSRNDILLFFMFFIYDNYKNNIQKIDKKYLENIENFSNDIIEYSNLLKI